MRKQAPKPRLLCRRAKTRGEKLFKHQIAGSSDDLMNQLQREEFTWAFVGPERRVSVC
jgi:hypothetical protein